MNKTKLLISIALCFSISNAANAGIQLNNTVTLVGVENHGQDVYVGITPNPLNCLYSGVYFVAPLEIEPVLSVATDAKKSGLKVRIDYTQNPVNGQCIGSSIYLQ